jgi:hypothetical protein
MDVNATHPARSAGKAKSDIIIREAVEDDLADTVSGQVVYLSGTVIETHWSTISHHLVLFIPTFGLADVHLLVGVQHSYPHLPL